MPYKDHNKRLEYIKRYTKEKQDKITISIPKGKRELYQSHADSRKISLTKFITDCIEKEIGKTDKGGI